MINPEPVEPPRPDCASIETTDGRTLCAISATDPAGLSIAEVVFTKLTERPKSEPEDDAPNAPPTTPTTRAIKIAVRSEIERPSPL